MLFLARLLIRGYQLLVSPVLSFLAGPGGGCRFEPTCSAYFLEALETHGLLRGSWFGVCRLARCNPWGGRGHDPVPPESGRGLSAPTTEVAAQRRLPHSDLPHPHDLVCE